MRKSLDTFLDSVRRIQRGPDGERVAVTTNHATGERSLVIGAAPGDAAGAPTYSVKLADVARGTGWLRQITAKCELCGNLATVADLHARANMPGVCPVCVAGADRDAAAYQAALAAREETERLRAAAIAAAAAAAAPAPVAEAGRDPVTGEA